MTHKTNRARKPGNKESLLIRFIFLALAIVLASCASSPPPAKAAAAALPAPVPEAPTGLIATAGPSQVALSWDWVLGADSYNVYFDTFSGFNPDAAAKIEHVGNQSTVIDGLVPGQMYYFIVKAVDPAGESRGSAPATAVAAFSPPPAPSQVRLVPLEGALSVSWVPAPGAKSYTVLLSAEPAGSKPLGEVSVATTSCALTALKKGTAYVVQVMANGPGGLSDPSPAVSGTPF